MNNIKNISKWLVIIAISLGLIITTFNSNFSLNTNQDSVKIGSINISKSELQSITNKIKKKYYKLENINDSESKVNDLIKKHIIFNAKIKKLNITCSEKEILFTILHSNIFKKNGIFSIDKYKNYIKNKKITENILQTNIKIISEYNKIKNVIKKSKYKNNHLKKINYMHLITLIKINYLNKNIPINNSIFNFEKKYINTYLLKKISKIKYFDLNKKKYVKTIISKNDINKAFFYFAKKNNFIEIKNNKKQFFLKIIKIQNCQIKNLDKNIYKKFILNEYKINFKNFFLRKLEKKVNNKELNKKIIERLYFQKKIFINKKTLNINDFIKMENFLLIKIYENKKNNSKITIIPKITYIKKYKKINKNKIKYFFYLNYINKIQT